MTVLRDIARLPAQGDNAAIAIRNLDDGTRFTMDGGEWRLSHPVLEGHRFAVTRIEEGDPVLSWGQPFGFASRDIEVGEYLCNAAMLAALGMRSGDFHLPAEPNFEDADLEFAFDEAGFRPGSSPAPCSSPGSFEGFARPGGRRGTGTRNYLILLGASSLTASFARALEGRLRGASDAYPNVDGIVAVAHTEGGGDGTPNNREELLRALAGFMVHPNVGAVLALDRGDEPLNNAILEGYLRTEGYPLDDVPHRFYTVSKDLEGSLGECEELVRRQLDAVNRSERTTRPLSELKVALQCGGSDAFSGVSGNPLAARVARELIMHGGSAVLAETDELIGAEPYILDNTRALDTARAFLEKIRKFEERAAWHGQSVRDNPTGGNKFRGLYNITLKSVGAARKKDPDVCLDYVIDYGERLSEAGYYFMDSPGNDLESTAGQVAAGCNLIFFITGNGAITNFPFTPTIKIITTTGRWELMPCDMDVNAGRYLDGEPLEDLADETFRFTVDVASGTRSAGEKAGHSQVSIWREWRQSDATRLPELMRAERPDGRPVEIEAETSVTGRVRAYPVDGGHAVERVGLIIPTSLCSGQIAARIANRLNDSLIPGIQSISRCVALVHTEGCGVSSGENEEIFLRTLTSYLRHPCVAQALLLEHGCEHTHNDLFQRAIRDRGMEPEDFGYASIQLDGGIDRVTDKVGRWFEEKTALLRPEGREDVGLGALSLGMATGGRVPAPVAETLAQLGAAIVGQGGTVVIPSDDRLLASAGWLDALGLEDSPGPTLAYGEPHERAGLHVMETPGGHMVEALSGLGATGVQLMLVYAPDQPVQTHPLVRVLQFTETTDGDEAFLPDFDLVVKPGDDDPRKLGPALLKLVCDTASGDYVPRLWGDGYTDFQVTRGMLGVSL